MRCQLNDYPRYMGWGPTADMVSGDLVACYELSCDIYKNGEWNHLVDTRESRRFHSSVVKDNRVLLIGGRDATTTTEFFLKQRVI